MNAVGKERKKNLLLFYSNECAALIYSPVCVVFAIADRRLKQKRTEKRVRKENHKAKRTSSLMQCHREVADKK